MTGRTIYEQSIVAGQKNLSLALHDSPAGIYKVQVVLDTRTETHSISVQK